RPLKVLHSQNFVKLSYGCAPVRCGGRFKSFIAVLILAKVHRTGIPFMSLKLYFPVHPSA
ncbi:MAG: hypothetical protein ACTTI5_04110, partial [Treponema sp.]